MPMVLRNFVRRLLHIANSCNRNSAPQMLSQSLLQPSFDPTQCAIQLWGSLCFGRPKWLSYSVMFLLVLVLGACGPDHAATDKESAVATSQEIAITYQATHDLDAARAQLRELDVANVNQWLILATESAIKSNGNTSETSALVNLTLDLGLQSNVIVNYARQNNLPAEQAASIVVPPVVSNSDSTAGNTVASNVGGTANNVGNVIIPLPVETVADLNSSDIRSSDRQPATGAVASEQVGEASSVTATVAIDSAAPSGSATSTATPELTATPDAQPIVRAASGINVRTGPGVDYDIAGAMNADESAQILSKNQAGDWWEILLASGAKGWVYSPLVEIVGDVSAINVALTIPTPPPTAVPVATTAPVQPAPEEPAAPAPAPGGPDFRVTEKRLWDVVENGGRLDGPSVTCGEKRQLVVNVLDGAGNRLNGVAVQAIYGAQEIFVTGEQGKGDGLVEFVLGGGQALKVIRDADGREVSSEEVSGLSTKPWEIPYETLIGGHFCTDDASCKSFADNTGCYGHYSWTVTFQRNY